VARACRALERALVERAHELRNVEVVHVLSLAGGEYLAPHVEQSLRHSGLFLGKKSREAERAGRADYMTIFVSEIPQLFRNGTLRIDFVLIQIAQTRFRDELSCYAHQQKWL
jgi:acyl-CoA hydrolase